MLSASQMNVQPSSLSTDQTCRRFSVNELRSATQNFAESFIIGRGGFGNVYKGLIDGTDRFVAIKRLHSMSQQGTLEFRAEVEMLSKLRHLNLVSLIGFCDEGKEMLLIYDYMRQGTLEDHLHKAGASLTWLQRLKICLGAARGLDYLHTGTGDQQGIIHRDVKSSNVLLDENFVAKISDFGLAKFCPINQTRSYVNTEVKGTFGYMDLQYFYTGKLTRKSDVYSFGVILLEVICGRPAVDTTIDEDQWGLAPWAQDNIKQGKLNHIIDLKLRGQTSNKCLKEFARLASSCLHHLPSQRPSMAEIVYKLEVIVSLQKRLESSVSEGKLIDKILFFRNAKVESKGNNSTNEDESSNKVNRLMRPLITNTQNYSIFAATWNVGGKAPTHNMNLDALLHAAPPADIYVLGFQEIAPLNAANILGVEDNGPAGVWLNLIRITLNKLPGIHCGNGRSYTPSVPVAEYDLDPIAESDPDSDAECDSDSQGSQARFEQNYSLRDQAISGPRYYSELVSFDDNDAPMEDLLNNSSSPMLNQGSNTVEDGNGVHYHMVAGKQMVGIFLTVWVRSSLREHFRILNMSCVGRGLMGYLGTKGSVSMSMLLHQTSFCFVCSHLSSGEKEGDELRRNHDFMEIVKKTRFPRVQGMKDEKSPETILEHDRIIWLGDVNYRVALSNRVAKALVEMQNWRALLEHDQLRTEQRSGRVFHGWKEGKIYFPPTYKYATDSDAYAMEAFHHNEKRTPSWCDRILWYGSGLHQLSYCRGESRFSNHRPVYSIFWAEVESIHDSNTSVYDSLDPTTNRIKVEPLLPYTNAYTDLLAIN